MPQLGIFRKQIIDIDGHVGAVEGADAEVDDAGRDRGTVVRERLEVHAFARQRCRGKSCHAHETLLTAHDDSGGSGVRP